MDWVLLDSFDNIAQAGLIKSLLEQNQIQGRYKNFYTSSVIGDLPFVEVRPEIWVNQEQHAQASLLVKQSRQINTNQVDWLCSNCGEQNPSTFEVCWACNSEI